MSGLLHPRAVRGGSVALMERTGDWGTGQRNNINVLSAFFNWQTAGLQKFLDRAHSGSCGQGRYIQNCVALQCDVASIARGIPTAL